MGAYFIHARLFLWYTLYVSFVRGGALSFVRGGGINLFYYIVLFGFLLLFDYSYCVFICFGWNVPTINIRLAKGRSMFIRGFVVEVV